LEDNTLAFHNLKHTQSVVERTKEIAGHYHVNEREMLILYTAAWFHDTGYLFTEPSRHEEMSAEIMRKYMLDHTNDTELIKAIEGCIIATKPPRSPSNLLEQIICDADTYNLGTKEFKATNKRAMEEHKLRFGSLDKLEFNRETLKMLEGHEFFTSYCKDLLSVTKELNMKKLKKKIEEKTQDKREEDETVTVEGQSLADIEKDKSGLM